jgi:hypothetical protein
MKLKKPKRKSRHIIFGTLPVGEINATAISVPSSKEYVVVFESDLFTFCNLICKSVSKCITAWKEPDGRITYRFNLPSVIDNITNDQEIVIRFREIIIGYLMDGTPAAARPYILEDPSHTLSVQLLNSMELFILGHEYAHILLGHFDRNRTVASLLAGQKIKRILRPWEQEYDADRLGLQLMINAMERDRERLVSNFTGPNLFFKAMDIIQRGASLIRTGKPSHQFVVKVFHASLRIEVDPTRHFSYSSSSLLTFSHEYYYQSGWQFFI